jgi:hypothetical protein
VEADAAAGEDRSQDGELWGNKGLSAPGGGSVLKWGVLLGGGALMLYLTLTMPEGSLEVPGEGEGEGDKGGSAAGKQKSKKQE